MNDNKIAINEKAILVGIIHGEINEFIINEHLDELELLTRTAGAKVIGKITQKISKINPATFIGKGKANQLILQAKELNAHIIIFDQTGLGSACLLTWFRKGPKASLKVPSRSPKGT